MAATGRNEVPCSLFAWRRFPTPENREALTAGRSRRGWPGVHQSPFASFALHSPGLSSGGTEFNPRRMLVGALLLHNIREIRLLRTAVRRTDHGNATWVSAHGGTAGNWISTRFPDRGTQNRYVIFPTGRQRPGSDVD